MKRIIFILFIILIISSFVFAKDLFITIRICPVYSSASPTSERSGMLQQGAKVSVLKEIGDWIYISSSSIKGYVQKMFTGTQITPSRNSRVSMDVNLSNITTRKRASYYSSSAAATRGLSSENIRDRENVSFKSYDFDSIRWLERFVFSEEELIKFARKEGLWIN